MAEPVANLTLGASVITPFDDNGEINKAAFVAQLDRLADASLDLWVVSSGTAEANVLSDDEIDRMAGLAVSHIGGRANVYAMGREPRSAVEAIEFASRMADRGLAAVQIGPLDPGHSYMPTEAELRSFYTEVLPNVSAQCFLASHTSVGYEVPPSLLAEVTADHAGQVVGINATHLQSYTYVSRLVDATGGAVPVLMGSPVHALEGLALGAAGIISSMDVNVAPHLYSAFAHAWAAKDHDAINDTYATVLRLFLEILGSGGLLVAKAVLTRLGLPAGPARPPRRKPDDATFAKADEIIAKFNLPDI